MRKPELKRDDGTYWVASYKTEADTMASLFGGVSLFYFREVERNPQWRWWKPWQREWLFTGKTWEGEGKPGVLRQNGFTVLKVHGRR